MKIFQIFQSARKKRKEARLFAGAGIAKFGFLSTGFMHFNACD
jgi:hypothetical protein